MWRCLLKTNILTNNYFQNQSVSQILCDDNYNDEDCHDDDPLDEDPFDDGPLDEDPLDEEVNGNDQAAMNNDNSQVNFISK